MKRGIRIFILIVTHILLAMPLRFIFKIESSFEYARINKNGKYIIAANHPSRLDPFLILAALPLKTFIKLAPFVFVTSDKYLKNWSYKYILIMWGCVSNKKEKEGKPVEVLIKRLENNETIFLFPGGELEKEGKLKSPQVGTIYLEREVKDSYILPVKVEISNRINLMNLLKRKIKTKIKFKKEFRHEEFEENLQPLANELYNKIIS